MKFLLSQAKRLSTVIEDSLKRVSSSPIRQFLSQFIWVAVVMSQKLLTFGGGGIGGPTMRANMTTTMTNDELIRSSCHCTTIASSWFSRALESLREHTDIRRRRDVLAQFHHRLAPSPRIFWTLLSPSWSEVVFYLSIQLKEANSAQWTSMGWGKLQLGRGCCRIDSFK